MGNSGPNPAPIRWEGAGTLPLPQSGYTGAHRRSRSAFLLSQEVCHTLALCSQLQFLQLAVVILIYHLLDRPEGEQQIAVAPTAGLGKHLCRFCGDESSLLQLTDVLADGKFDFVVGADGVKIFEPIDDIIVGKFLFYIFQFYSRDLSKIGGYSRHYKYIKNKPFPLPPLAEQKRIVAKIEELLPYIDHYEQAWSKLEQFNSRFPEDMKKSLLQYAIQGKLVEQRPEEGTAEELFTQIQEEKQRLIAEKKIKKEKPLPEITEDEKPFDIPESWKWVRLLDVCKTVADGDHQAPPQVPSGIPFLVISNISKGNLDFSNTRYVTQEYFDSLAYDRIAESNDILFSVTGSYGIPVIVDCEQKFCFQRHIALIKGMININYLWLLLGSPVVKAQCDKVATGTAQKTVGLKSLKSIVVPLPPLVEQKRIVEKLEQLLPLCERLK